MDQNFKKYLLEMVILLKLNVSDYYGYDLVQEVYQLLSVKEGVTYPILKKLINDDKIESYMNEDDFNTRKYYKITKIGRLTCEKLVSEYKDFTSKLNILMKGFDLND